MICGQSIVLMVPRIVHVVSIAAESQVGYQTWYPNADPSYIQRCQVKDEQTTQATFGFKICGMQVCCICAPHYPCRLKATQLTKFPLKPAV